MFTRPRVEHRRRARGVALGARGVQMARTGLWWSVVVRLLCPLLRCTFAANVVAPIRTSDVQPCSCPDPVEGDEVCYEPVCPPGYFRCCASCGESACYNEENLMISWRGVPECILCNPGDFCDGCDVFAKCPESKRPGREGPRVSKAGASRMADCEACPVGYEAWLDNMQCAPPYSMQSDECNGKPCCNKEFVQRCMRSCESPDITRRKQLNDCEQMKCIMYCAKQWSDGCAQAVGKHCQYVNAPEALESNGFVDPTVKLLYDCDVDCNGAQHRHLVRLVVVVAFGLFAHTFADGLL